MAPSKVVGNTSTQTQAQHRDDLPTTFDQVLGRELLRVNDSRTKRDVPVEASPENLIGLAFSGGGIRSATFNLGILQAFAQKGLLRKFDYLSTVSGGGYIGSWLAALTRRVTAPMADPSFSEVEKVLSPCKYEPDRRSETPVVHWLRLYSNYLTPHTGVISGDTWAMIGTWLRDVILNQTILGMVFVSVFVLCQSVLLPLVKMEDNDDGMNFLIAGGLVLFLGCVAMAVNVVSEAPPNEIPKTWFQRIKAWFRRIQVTLTVMLPFVVACVLLNCALWQNLYFADKSIGLWAAAGAAFYLLVWGIVAVMALLRRLRHHFSPKPARRLISVVALLIFSPVAGAVGGCFMRAYVLLLRHLPPWIYTSTDWVVVVFGSGVLMVIMLLVAVLHLGLVGRGSMDVVREWWARLGGYLMLITLGWLLLAGISAFAPLGVRWLLTFKLPSITAIGLWVLHNFAGVKAASSAKTSGKNTYDPNAKKDSAALSDSKAGSGSWISKALESPRILNAVAKAAPYVFIVGLVLLLSTTVHIATGLAFQFEDTAKLWSLNSGLKLPALSEQYWAILEGAPRVWLPCIGGIFILAAIGLSWRVDVNDFSLHHFYRNRLVRCYLGASNPERKAEPFTGFDPGDDVSLCELADNYPGPYPILNAALNITGGEELGYATRRAKSFAFTPLYCGYELGASGEGMQRFSCADGFLPSYSKTECGRSASGLGKFGAEGGISLGTAMAISGAAASPNMGYYTSPATAFFMALFDVRLGWWMGNSRDPKKWKSTGPALGLGYLFSEVLAQSDQQKGYVYLSDGGHFENLAVYELIRRRCRVIVACDAGADGSYQFDNLVSLIEKARTDFGARIEIDYGSTRPSNGGRESQHNWVSGTIYYDPHDATDTGTLILIKAGMPVRGAAPSGTGDRKLPDDVWRYRDQHPTFPHESTADQWFDEWQFESYRALGEYVGCHAADGIRQAIDHTLQLAKPRPVPVAESSDDLAAVSG
ncbi:MAG TPA: patatin-like phospholipase family protein [Candidatus Sulfotelmatobacter sp.]|nr:patatin-like phospholipase family protein [Candidatus Sulfotelmatobacter sp.]